MLKKRASAVALEEQGNPERLPLGGIVLLAIAIFLGGGHIHGPVRNGLIESAAAVLLLSLAWRQRQGSRSLPSSARMPMFLWLAVLTLLLLYLVPLPPSLSPGNRAMTDAVRALDGVPVRWRPLSLDPAATIRMAAALIVPIAMTFATLSAGPRGRILLLRALLLGVIGSAVLGMVQLALGYPAWATPFGKSDPGVADGLFVNRNHQSMFMLAGISATGLLIRLEGARSGSALRLAIGAKRVHAAWLLMPLLAMMTVASASRAGIALLLLVLPASVALAIGRRDRARSGGARRGMVALILALLVIALAVAMLPSETAATLRSRLVFRGDTRLDVLPDLMTAVGQYWPWGSGPGTFVPIFMGIEDLDKLGPAYLNHAHNEYLEWTTETGLPGLLLLIAAAAGLIARLWLVLASVRSDHRKALAVGGGAIIALLAAHSAIDYPLRTDAHAALFGLALGLLFTPALDHPPSAAQRPRRHRLAIAALVVMGMLFSARILQLRLAEAAAGDADPALAAVLHRSDGFANAYVAQASLAAGRPAIARAQALAALDQTPLAIVAVRTLALAEAKLGNAAAGRAAWRAAAGMGWRDIPTQYWAMRQALADGEHDIAGMRADALLRTSGGTGPFADLTRNALGNAALRQALVARMTQRPEWRRIFFYTDEPIAPAELDGMVAALHDLRRTSAPPTREEARAAILALLNRGRVAEALALDRGFAPLRRADPGSLLDDGGFDRALADYQGRGTPFDWTLLGVSRNSATLDESLPRSMLVATEGSEGLSPLRRWVVLAPGRYRLDYRMQGSAEAPSSVGIWVSCGGASPPLAQSGRDALASDGFEARSLTFDVPPSCPAIIISIGGTGTQPAEAAFDDIALRPLPPLPQAR